MSMTILERYMNEKEFTYHPIMRRGLPRGATLGIQNKIKFEAALHVALLNTKPASIADRYNLPSQTMRGWFAQPAWKNTVNKLQKEFAALVVSRLQQIIEDQRNGSTRSIHNYPDFLDAQNYSRGAILEIAKQCYAAEGQRLAILYIILFGSDESKDQVDSHFLKCQLLKVREIMNAQKHLSVDDREQVLTALNWAFDYVMEGGL